MLPESIKKKRKMLFSECRDLLFKINGQIQDVHSETASLAEKYIQSFEENNCENHVCEGCQQIDIPDEKMTRIESGQWLCLACLSAFYATSHDVSHL